MCDMATGRLELCNRIRMEAEDIERTGFPLEVLPQAVQSVILDMATYENYKIEFIATAMLSAVSAALGGAYRIRIKGDWQSSGALYVILVGRPGLGKTHRWRPHIARSGNVTMPFSRCTRQKWRHGKPREKTGRNLS